MGTCLSKKNGSSTSPNKSDSQHRNYENSVTVTLSKPTEPEVSLKNKTLQEKQQGSESAPQDEGEVKKEILIIKHRKSHDEREKTATSKTPSPCIAPQQGDGVFTNEETMVVNKIIAPSTPSIGVVGVRTSSCTKDEVDEILIQCGRLSRSSSRRKYSGSKRSFDFDHCDNDTTSAEDDQRKSKGNGNGREENDVAAAASESGRHHQSPRRSQGRRRTPSRERDQSSGRERRVSRSPGRRSSDTNTTNASNNNTSSRPGKMVSVPATVSSLVMDKSNNCGGESGAKRITVKRNVGDAGSRGTASPRAQSPARVNGNVGRDKVLNENQQHQQQPSLSRNNSSRKAEQSPYRRIPQSEVDHKSSRKAEQSPYRRNPQSEVDHNSSRKAEQSPYRRNPLSEVDTNRKVQQNKPKIEGEAIQKPNGRVALEKGMSVDCKTKEQHEEESSLPVGAVVKTTVVSSGVDNLKPQGLTRSRSSRRSRDLDISSPEAVVNPTNSYASLLLEDIQNFHQKNTQQQQSSISLPACLNKACSILEAVADLNSTTSSNFTEDKRSPSTQQSIRDEYYGKKVASSNKDPFVESEVAVSDDVMEPSLHKYVTVKRGGGVVDMMEDQESSGSNSFTVSSSGQQHHWGNNISCSSWEPNSADSTDCWTSSRLSFREEEEDQKTPLELGCSLSSEAKKKKGLNSKRRECDHEHSSGIGRGRLGSNKGMCVCDDEN
ncbi:hypothetical protein JHK87_040699 [Glycine soja]|nr:hypothetical protein JHK87_040699 [Glycine soja]